MEKKNDSNIDKRKLEQNQNVTKEYAVSYAMLAYNNLHPNGDVEKFALKMIEIIRAMKPKYAVKQADKLLK